MHLRHVRAPQHKGIGGFDVVVAAHRLVDAEGADEPDRGGRHAVPRIRVDIVGAETGFHQLERGIAFPDRPLTGTEHADAAGPALFQRVLELDRHDVEGFVPRHRRELAVFVVLAVGLAQHRLGQAVMAVHDLGKKIALDAIEAAIYLRLDVAMRGNDAVFLGRYHDAAAGAAEAAGGLVPLQLVGGALGDEVGGRQVAAPVCRIRRGRDSGGVGRPHRAGRPRGGAQPDLSGIGGFAQAQRGGEPVVGARQRGEKALHQPQRQIVAHLVEPLQCRSTRVRRIAAVAGRRQIAQAEPGIVVAGADQAVEIDFGQAHRPVLILQHARRCRPR